MLIFDINLDLENKDIINIILRDLLIHEPFYKMIRTQENNLNIKTLTQNVPLWTAWPSLTKNGITLCRIYFFLSVNFDENLDSYKFPMVYHAAPRTFQFRAVYSAKWTQKNILKILIFLHHATSLRVGSDFHKGQPASNPESFSKIELRPELWFWK